MAKKHPPIRNYFVDEAGDTTIFGKKQKSLLGTQGVSRYFILGVCEVPDPGAIAASLENLRQELLSSPKFSNVPSMQPENRKTAIYFHAKDDLAEIRSRVFELISRHPGIKFSAVVRDKKAIESEYRWTGLRYSPNSVYDEMATILFKQHLHKGDEFNVCFAQRGSSDRTQALSRALHYARENAMLSWGVQNNAPLAIAAKSPVDEPCLQVCDYLLWALQRVYERREEEHYLKCQACFSVVLDRDDTREASYGRYYDRKRQLRVSKLPPLT